MSTTAGLGSGDYVAINVPAIFALVFGVASALSLLDNLLLVFPVVAVVIAGVAFWQVHRSNGTQSGRALAIAGMVLALGFTSWCVGRIINTGIENRADERHLAQVVKQFQEDVVAGRYDTAYAQTSERFKGHVKLQQFQARWDAFKTMAYGPLTQIGFNGQAAFSKDAVTDAPIAVTVLQMKFATAPDSFPQTGVFRKTGDQWQLDDIVEFFQTGPTGP